jgi:hypothetical protein
MYRLQDVTSEKIINLIFSSVRKSNLSQTEVKQDAEEDIGA